jgi:hypothetical protein
MQCLCSIASCSQQSLLLWELGPGSGCEVFPIVTETQPQRKTVTRCWQRGRVMNGGLPVQGLRESAASQPQNGPALHLEQPLQTKTPSVYLFIKFLHIISLIRNRRAVRVNISCKKCKKCKKFSVRHKYTEPVNAGKPNINFNDDMLKQCYT